VDGQIDGFRFDLASVLGRDRHGNVLLEPPVINRISEDSLLRDNKLIAEPWMQPVFIRSEPFRALDAGRTGTADTETMSGDSGAAIPT